MPQANVIKWKDGAGWLVLSGGSVNVSDGLTALPHNEITSEMDSDIDGKALTHMQAGEPIAYIWAASDADTADNHLNALDELGAPTGYLVDVLTEDDDTLRQQLSSAGMIILGDGPNLDQLRSGLMGAAIEGIAEAYRQGAIIYAIGHGASVLGSILVDNSNKPGMGWLENAIIMPAYHLANQAAKLHELLLKNPQAIGLGLGSDSALALGPEGQIETWGRRAITVKLGASFS